ncbi:MAG TPA: serine--tRNA ligase [Nitrososphaerales archaeon]|nr:serine--tRNA ligase [Nitrososphaerales archaeon]
MMDIKLVREDPDAIVESLKKRGAEDKLPLVKEAANADAEWRRLKTEVDRLRHRQNELTGQVAALKKKGEPLEDKLKEVKDIPRKIKELEAKADEKNARLAKILMNLPNMLHESVPLGRDESQSVTVRTWGKHPDFGFEVKDHIDLLASLGMVDMERGAKVAGARFYFLKGDAVKLEHAIMQYALDFLRSRGFVAVEPPFMLNRSAYEGVVNLEDFGPVIYKIEGEDLHLIATSEHPLVSMHMDEILDAAQLPIKYCGFSPCFRVEAGAHGKDTKGIFRVHQFYKVEQVVFSRPEDSWKMHEELISNAERIYQALGLPYRVVALCSGDTGFMSAKTYDLEAWLPGQGKYREMASASNVTDFQARRLHIRYREKQNEPTVLVHTLNSTAVVARTLVALVENYQQKDGSVKIPRVLAPYMGGIESLQRR